MAQPCQSGLLLIIIGKWSLPQRSSWTFHEKSRYSDGSQMLRSIVDWETEPECKYVTEPSLRRDRLRCSMRSLIILPLLSFLKQPQSLLCVLKSPSKTIGRGSWLLRSSRSFLSILMWGRHSEHTVIDLKHIIRAATACWEVLRSICLCANMFFISRATPPWNMPLFITPGQW